MLKYKHQCKTILDYLVNIARRKQELQEWEVAGDYLINFWTEEAEKLL